MKNIKKNEEYEPDIYYPQKRLYVLRRRFPSVDKSYNEIPKKERCNDYDRIYLAVLRHVMLTWYDMYNPLKNVDWKNMSYLLDEQE